MAKSKDLALTIKIAGKLDKSLASTLSQATKDVSAFSKSLQGIGKAGLAGMAAIATGTLAIIGDCTKEAEKLESSMADVMRYVDGVADANGQASKAIAQNGKTYEENYKAIRSYIQDLSTEIPRTTEQLATASAALGQSGIGVEAQLNSGYLRDVAVAASGMDIDDELAGNYIAKWEQAFNMNHEEVMQLMDQINYLGANNATTAAEIAQSVNEAASLGQIAGVDVSTTAALATAMQATGVDAGKVGTSIKRIFTNISKGSSATKAQKEAFESMGMNAEQIAKDMQSNPNGTLLSIFQGIQNLDKDKQVATMSTLFGQWAIEGGAKIVNNLEAYTAALEQVQSGDYAGSLEREFAITVGTTESAAIMLSNAFKDLKQDIGEGFLPAKGEFMRSLTQVFNTVRDHLPDIERLTDKLIPVIDTTMKSITDTLMAALPVIEKVIDFIADNPGTVTKGIGGAALTFGALSNAPLIETLLGGGGKAAGGAISSLFGLKGDISTAIFGRRFKNGGSRGGLINGAKGLWESGKKTAGGIGSWLGNVGSAAGRLGSTTIGSGILGQASKWGGILKEIGAGVYEATFKDVIDGLPAVGSFIADGFKNSKLGTGISALIGKVSGPAQKALGIGGSLLGKGGSALGALGSFGGSALNLGATALGPFWSTMGGGFMSMFTTAAPIIAAISGIIAVVSILGDHLEDIRTIIGNTFGEKGLAVFDTFTRKLGAVGDFISGLFEDGGVAKALEPLREILSGALGGDETALGAFDGLADILQTVMGIVGQVVNFATTYVKPIIQELFRFVTQTVVPGILRVFTAAAPSISNLLSAVGGVVMNIMTTIAQAIQFAMPYVEGLISAFLQVAGVAIPILVDTFTGVVSSIGSIIESIKGIFDGLITFITGVFTGNWEQAWEGVKGIFGSAFDALVELCKTPINSVIGIINAAIEGINEIFGDGITIPEWSPIKPGETFQFKLPTIPALAAGGFTDGPSLAGEAGREAVISFDSAYRSRNISNWLKAGEMLGMGSALKAINADGAGSGNYTFAPQITIQGNADESVINKLKNEMHAEFEQWTREMQRRQARIAF